MKNYVPRAAGTSKYTLVDAYLNRLAKGCKRVAESLKVNSTQRRPSNSSTTKRLKDRVMAELNGEVLKLEIIIEVTFYSPSYINSMQSVVDVIYWLKKLLPHLSGYCS